MRCSDLQLGFQTRFHGLQKKIPSAVFGHARARASGRKRAHAHQQNEEPEPQQQGGKLAAKEEGGEPVRTSCILPAQLSGYAL